MTQTKLPECEIVESDMRCERCHKTNVTYYGICYDCKEDNEVPDTKTIIIVSLTSVKERERAIAQRLKDIISKRFGSDCDNLVYTWMKIKKLIEELEGKTK